MVREPEPNGRLRHFRWTAIGIALLLGCLFGPARTGVPTEAERAAFGNVTLVDTTRDGDIYSARIGGGRDFHPAAAGVLLGSAAALNYGATHNDPVGSILFLPIWMIAAAAEADANRPTAAERAEVERTRRTIERAFAAAYMQETLSSEFLQGTRFQWGRQIRWERQPPVLPDTEKLDYDALADKGADTVIEIALVDVSASASGTRAPLGFRVKARVHIVRVRDRTTVRRHTLTYEDRGRQRDALEWTQDSGTLLIGELKHAASMLGRQLAEDVFARYRMTS